MDGFTAMWVAAQALQDQNQNPEWVSAQYGDVPPDVAGREVYIIDFSYPRHILEAMHNIAASIVVLDHHKSAKADLEGLSYCTFDMNESGASLTYKHFHKDEPLPALVDYVRDYDLWQHKLPYTHEINAWIGIHKFDMPVWTRLESQLENKVARAAAIQIGSAILKAEEKYVQAQQAFGVAGYLAGQGFTACNGTHLRSKVGDELSKKTGAGAVWFLREDCSVHWSLRSTRESGVDVSKIAAKFGGGGHATSAGFVVGWSEHAEMWARFPYNDTDTGAL
jgi:oligoribonuclease NrnB/cAMP/cGMP phosphodiesterase (DHH superfamily)